MRLWHYELISVLPRKQLISQWRELLAIKKKIEIYGTPNHLLVNKVLDYPLEHFKAYAMNIYIELQKRDYSPQGCLLDSIMMWDTKLFSNLPQPVLFNNWHTTKYLKQCYSNLEEKFDCEGISEMEWRYITTKYEKLTNINSIIPIIRYIDLTK